MEEDFIEDDEEECEYCGGTGELITPAYQSGGDIIDEAWERCLCQADYDEESDE